MKAWRVMKKQRHQDHSLQNKEEIEVNKKIRNQ